MVGYGYSFFARGQSGQRPETPADFAKGQCEYI